MVFSRSNNILVAIDAPPPQTSTTTEVVLWRCSARTYITGRTTSERTATPRNPRTQTRRQSLRARVEARVTETESGRGFIGTGQGRGEKIEATAGVAITPFLPIRLRTCSIFTVKNET